MATIVYLDADDEITSAVARLRAAPESKVGLVLPFGSRLATSRINFRLLAREAQSHGRDVAIIAPDAATRALAGSAGLSVFATVGEYEAGVAGVVAGKAATGAGAASGAGPAGPVAPPERETAAGTAPPAAGEAAVGEAAAASDQPRSRRRKPRTTPSDLEATMVVPAVPAIPAVPPPPPQPDRGATVIEGSGRNRAVRVVGPRRLGFSRNAMLVGAAVLAIAVLVAGVGAYVFLPSATIRLTPRVERLVPLSFEVRADPAVTEPDARAGVVPAERIAIPLGVSGTFPASGKRVEETKASGTVRFTSENTFVPVVIPAGTRVATKSGIDFLTREAVTVERASFFTGPTSATVAVDAQAAGPGGNVDAGAITEVSEDIRQFLISDNPVTNPEPTSGGTRTEFPRVEQRDVDGALGKLGTQLAAQFDERLADPATTPSGMTLFPTTKALGPQAPSIDPATLPGKEVASFDLGLTATGEVTAVDEGPLQELAAVRIRDAVPGDYRLVEASIEVSVGQPTIDGAIVLFPVSARAEQVRILDADALLASVKGRPIQQARATLEQYGTVDIEVWPDWVTAIPTLDNRLSFTIVDPVSDEPSGSASPSPTSTDAGASAPPTGSPPSVAPGSAAPSGSAAP